MHDGISHGRRQDTLNAKKTKGEQHQSTYVARFFWNISKICHQNTFRHFSILHAKAVECYICHHISERKKKS